MMNDEIDEFEIEAEDVDEGEVPEASYDDEDDSKPGADPAPNDDEGLNFDEPSAPAYEDRIERIKGSNKVNIEELYRKYLQKLDGSEGELFTALTKFAQNAVYGRMRESADADVNYKDIAQDAVISIWEQLDRFSTRPHPPSKHKIIIHPKAGDHPQGNTPSDFYSWVHNICFSSGKHAAGKVKKEHDSKVPLQVESDDDPGFMKDNPEVYKEREPYIRGYIKAVPDYIQGDNAMIFRLIQDGQTYKQIGEFVGMTENAVTKRVKRMREQVKAAKPEAKA